MQGQWRVTGSNSNAAGVPNDNRLSKPAAPADTLTLKSAASRPKSRTIDHKHLRLIEVALSKPLTEHRLRATHRCF
jgi:hypothetical protein